MQNLRDTYNRVHISQEVLFHRHHASGMVLATEVSLEDWDLPKHHDVHDLDRET